MTKIGCISLDKSEKVCIIQDVICDAYDSCHAMCFTLFMVTTIRRIHKISKIKNFETLNKMEVDMENSTDQGSKDNKIELISRKTSRKRKEMVLKRRNQVLYYLKVLLILLLKNLSHQKMDGMGIAS